MSHVIVRTTAPFEIVRFSDLLADPLRVATKLAAFAGLPAEHAAVAAALVRGK
jgi:hypothetical protein